MFLYWAAVLLHNKEVSKISRARFGSVLHSPGHSPFVASSQNAPQWVDLELQKGGKKNTFWAKFLITRLTLTAQLYNKRQMFASMGLNTLEQNKNPHTSNTELCKSLGQVLENTFEHRNMYQITKIWKIWKYIGNTDLCQGTGPIRFSYTMKTCTYIWVFKSGGSLFINKSLHSVMSWGLLGLFQNDTKCIKKLLDLKSDLALFQTYQKPLHSMKVK